MTDRGTIVLVVGSLHYDIMVEADHLPRRDETAVGSGWYPKFGGKGGNQAVSASLNGARSRMVGAVGADSFGAFLRDRLQASAVDFQQVATLAGTGSGMSVAIMDRAGDYAATIVSGANLLISPSELLKPQVWRDVGLLVLQNEVPDAVNIAAATEAGRRGIATLLNAAPWREIPAALRGLIDILVVNAVEAEMMGAAPIRDLQGAADAARTLAVHAPTVIVTAGALGLAAWRKADEPFILPAEVVEVVSSHGAGDSFVGALAAGLMRGEDLWSACSAASHAAALHVAGRSA